MFAHKNVYCHSKLQDLATGPAFNQLGIKNFVFAQKRLLKVYINRRDGAAWVKPCNGWSASLLIWTAPTRKAVVDFHTLRLQNKI